MGGILDKKATLYSFCSSHSPLFLERETNSLQREKHLKMASSSLTTFSFSLFCLLLARFLAVFAAEDGTYELFILSNFSVLCSIFCFDFMLLICCLPHSRSVFVFVFNFFFGVFFLAIFEIWLLNIWRKWSRIEKFCVS